MKDLVNGKRYYFINICACIQAKFVKMITKGNEVKLYMKSPPDKGEN